MDIEKVTTKERVRDIRRIRESAREESCRTASSVVGKSAVSELRELLSLYDERMYFLISELYDLGTGGFY